MRLFMARPGSRIGSPGSKSPRETGRSGLAIGPALLTQNSDSTQPQSDEERIHELTERAIHAVRLLPPAIAAIGLHALFEDDATTGLWCLAGLTAWTLFGAAIGHFVFTRHVLTGSSDSRSTGESRSQASGRSVGLTRTYGQRHVHARACMSQLSTYG